MGMNGSFFEGDADRILGVVDYYFPPDFKEYLLKEEFKWSRFDVDGEEVPMLRWVFWSKQHHEIEPSLSLDTFAGFDPNVCEIPKVRDNIKHALQKMILHPEFLSSLVQFWAPTKTMEGRTLVTTQHQPYAIGVTGSTMEIQQLCEYRMKMCTDYKFSAEVESGEQLGVPGRVFLYKFPESSPTVEYYSTKEYPQRDFALRCKIRGSWVVPVFEHSSHTCVGVLEMVSLFNRSSVWHDDESFLADMNDIFQEFGLQCFDGYKIFEMQCREKIKRNKELTPAIQEQELLRVLRSVCEIHELPLAMTWVPCSACDGLLQGPLWCKDPFFTGIEFLTDIFSPLNGLLKIGKCSHLRKGWVTRRALSSPNMLYFPDITKLSVDDYPLVPYARMCNFSGWFIICLQSSNTGDDIYVLEYFWSTSSKDNENILTRLKKILGTMEEKLENFRFASGLKLGHLSSVEVIDVQNDQKIHSVYEIQATRTFSSLDSDPSSEPSSSSVSNLRPG